MSSKDVFIGSLIAIITPILGFVIWVEYLTNYQISQAIDLMVRGSLYGEILSLSALANLPVFLILMRLKKYAIAQGILMMTILFSFVVVILKLM